MDSNKGSDSVAIIAIVAIVAVAAVLMVNTASITGAAANQNNLKIPEKQCHRIASNLDKAAGNVASEVYDTGEWLNPCTGEVTPATAYLEGMFYRVVHENGDSRGFVPLGTAYILCSDGSAEVTSRLGVYYYNQGKGWGIYNLWLNNPHLEDPYKVERCSTLT